MKAGDIKKLIDKIENDIDVRILYIHNDTLEVLTNDEKYFVLRKEQINGEM